MTRLSEDIRERENCDKMKSQIEENAKYGMYLQNRCVPIGNLRTLE